MEDLRYLRKRKFAVFLSQQCEDLVIQGDSKRRKLCDETKGRPSRVLDFDLHGQAPQHRLTRGSQEVIGVGHFKRGTEVVAVDPDPCESVSLGSPTSTDGSLEDSITWSQELAEPPRLTISRTLDQVANRTSEGVEKVDRVSQSTFYVEVPRPRYPKSQCWTETGGLLEDEEAVLGGYFSVPVPAKSCEVLDATELLLPEMAVATPSTYIPRVDENDYRTLHASNCTIYSSDSRAQPETSFLRDVMGLMCMPSDILSSKRGQTYMDASVRRDDDTTASSAKQLTQLPLQGLSIGTDVNGPLEFWVQSRVSSCVQVWYQLRSPSSEYLELWNDFQWLGNFARFALAFLRSLQSRNDRGRRVYEGRLISFKADFDEWLLRKATPETDQVRSQYGKPDYRQAISMYSTFVWHVAHEDPVQKSPVFDDIFCRSIKEQSWSPTDKTVVTPYVGQCFKHIFGDVIKTMRPRRPQVQRFSHVEVRARPKREPILAYADIRVGDIVCFKLNQDPEDHWQTRSIKPKYSKGRSAPIEGLNMAKKQVHFDTSNHLNHHSWNFRKSSGSAEDDTANLSASREPSSSQAVEEYMYITEVVSRPQREDPHRCVYRGLWCYQPGTWHTQLDTSFYPNKSTELFLSDHCNCPENYPEHRLAELHDIDSKVSVNLFSDEPRDCEFFCRTLCLFHLYIINKD